MISTSLTCSDDGCIAYDLCRKKNEIHVSLLLPAKATDGAHKWYKKTTASGNFVLCVNSKRMLAQEKNVWLAVQFYAWRQIWGDITSDERAVNGSGSG
ncbi:hypothetical protein GCM10022405_35000 [Gibbsiella dentisursi]|uniref:Uncharacterized protein n=1 Tax=Gibbsiella dentisursi TaxID=796890 RepID=A0ABP7LQR4_9GAMM